MPTGFYKHRPEQINKLKQYSFKEGEAHKSWNKGMKGQYKLWPNGRTFTKESKKKMSETAIRNGNRPPRNVFYGEKSNFWKGGISEDPYPFDWTNSLRDNIRQRDNYVCQICGLHQDELNNWYKKLDVHHIDYNKDNLDPTNLIILCRSCHIKTNHNREYWIKYFQYFSNN